MANCICDAGGSWSDLDFEKPHGPQALHIHRHGAGYLAAADSDAAGDRTRDKRSQVVDKSWRPDISTR